MNQTHNKHLLRFCALAVFVALAAAPAQAVGISLKIEFGKRNSEGNCGPGRGICSITLGASLKTAGKAPGVVNAEGEIKGETLYLTFPNGLPAEAKGDDGRTVLPIARETPLDPANARSLGYSRIILLPGEYLVDGDAVRIKVAATSAGPGDGPAKGDKKNKN